ncbi:MAG: hypothetical protein KDA78_19920, partial [Planctomycetaceae bacterium]|nr:hypothetical protein [Planctomycetaceae bacterium]
HQVDAIDYLTWILFQYDLTFAWTKETVLTIVPVEDPVVIEKRHTLTTAQQKEAQEKFGARFSQATWVRQSERSCQVTGPVELHQALGDWLVGKPEKTNTPKRIAWRDRRLTLEVKNKPLGEVLKFLTDAGLPLVYDLEELRKAGHLPEMLISFQVDQATADQVLKAICDPLKIPLKVTDEEIRLLPQD